MIYILNVPRLDEENPGHDEVDAVEIDVPESVRLALVNSQRVDYATAQTLTLQGLFDLILTEP